MYLFKKVFMIFLLTVYSVAGFADNFQETALYAVFTRVFEGLPVEGEYSSIQDETGFYRVSKILHLMSDEKKQAWLSFLREITKEGSRDHKKMWSGFPTPLVEKIEEEIFASDTYKPDLELILDQDFYWEESKLLLPSMVELENLSEEEWESLIRIVHFIREYNRDSEGFKALVVLASVVGLYFVSGFFYFYQHYSLAAAVTPEVGILLEQMKGKNLYEICTGEDEWQTSSVGCRQILLKNLL